MRRDAGWICGSVGGPGGEHLQVRHEPDPHRVLHVHALHGHEVPGHLGRALPESDAVIVHGEAMRVVVEIGEALALDGLEVIDGHLKNFSLFQLGRAALFQRGWDQPLELVEGIVDTVPPSLLNDSSSSLTS